MSLAQCPFYRRAVRAHSQEDILRLSAVFGIGAPQFEFESISPQRAFHKNPSPSNFDFRSAEIFLLVARCTLTQLPSSNPFSLNAFGTRQSPSRRQYWARCSNPFSQAICRGSHKKPSLSNRSRRSNGILLRFRRCSTTQLPRLKPLSECLRGTRQSPSRSL